MNLSFYTTFDQGAVRCGVGDPPEKPQVTLKMKADILDKLFTGRENGPKAAMSGKLSFTGDTIKAMSLQRIQKDLNRLYTEARAEVGNLDALSNAPRTEGPAQSNPPPAEALAAAVPSGTVANARVESSSVIFATRSLAPSRKCTRTDSSLRRAAT